MYTRRKDGAKAPSLLDHLGHFDAKAWNLEPGTWNLDFGTWNLRNLKTWSLDLALMLKPSNCD